MTQLVLQGNRIIAHGTDCFFCMGGTVVCPSSGRYFENATVVEVDCDLPNDIDRGGYEYRGGCFYPCSRILPQTADTLKLSPCATVDDALDKLAGTTAFWNLIQSYTSAGSYSFTATDNMHIGIYMIGGGGMGGKYVGGAAGYAKNIEADVSTGDEITIVVGQGVGRSGSLPHDTTVTIDGTAHTAAHGASGEYSEVQQNPIKYSNGASGGQGSDAGGNSDAGGLGGISPYGCQRTIPAIYANDSSSLVTSIIVKHGGNTQSVRDGQNRFDTSMVTLAAGGSICGDIMQSGATVTGGKAGNAGNVWQVTEDMNATGYGNGGGANSQNSYSHTSCASGSDGAVFIYRRGI